MRIEAIWQGHHSR